MYDTTAQLVEAVEEVVDALPPGVARDVLVVALANHEDERRRSRALRAAEDAIRDAGVHATSR